MASLKSNIEEEGSQPEYKIRVEKDVPITMPDGVRLFADIYRPDAEGEFPGLLSYSPYGKELQTLTKPVDINDYETVSMGWNAVEAGNTEFFVPRGYVQVIPDTRGCATSEGKYSGEKEAEDGYHIIEWMAEQPWCNGKVGLNGISYYASSQWRVAATQPPHLAAICIWEGWADNYRDANRHGGIV